MKNSCIALLMALLPIISLSQPTTEEEYNYVTKGYSVQVENGLDMKKGYRMEEVGRWVPPFHRIVEDYRGIQKPSQWSADLKALYRDGQNSPCAWMMTVTHRNTPSMSYRFCIPTSDSEVLWNRTSQTIAGLGGGLESETMYQALFWAMMKAYTMNP